ncbi:MAG: hypothetical protein KME27_30750 [Lyngbya sp. HA4199-MV5]|nr:hypothetical protein [Lyngbya sp. HA4199-MV5]
MTALFAIVSDCSNLEALWQRAAVRSKPKTHNSNSPLLSPTPPTPHSPLPTPYSPLLTPHSSPN